MIILNDGTEHEIGQSFVPSVEVIAFALSNINRFTGHVGNYSVAQHCVLIAREMLKRNLPKKEALAGLLHDAPEAYIGDVSAPLKRFLPNYKNLESYYHDIIDEYFGVHTESMQVKEYDLRMLVTEAKGFGLPLEKFPDVDPFDIEITRWTSVIACGAFLEMYCYLTGESLQGVIPYETEEEKEAFENIESAQLQSLDDRYYCQCTNKDCGSWYQLGKEGDTCLECQKGKLTPQDVG